MTASAGLVEPSRLFFMIDQDTLMASHISIMYCGTGPSKVMYHRADINTHSNRGMELVTGISGVLTSPNGGAADDVLGEGSSTEDEVPDLLFDLQNGIAAH